MRRRVSRHAFFELQRSKANGATLMRATARLHQAEMVGQEAREPSAHPFSCESGSQTSPAGCVSLTQSRRPLTVEGKWGFSATLLPARPSAKQYLDAELQSRVRCSELQP